MQKKELHFEFCIKRNYVLERVTPKKSFALEKVIYWKKLCNERNYTQKKFCLKEIIYQKKLCNEKSYT